MGNVNTSMEAPNPNSQPHLQHRMMPPSSPAAGPALMSSSPQPSSSPPSHPFDGAALPQSPILSSIDGYKWRKYGQKDVKGGSHPRSYFKCTFPGCGVRKQVEKLTEDGKVIDRISYRGGEHTHDPSRITRVNAQDQNSFKKSVINESCAQPELVVKTEPGRQDVEGNEMSPPGEIVQCYPASPRLVVETTSDVDYLDDGYNWRKYGQKKMKNTSSVLMRSYYKCTEEACPVKKQVEQRGNRIINIYEGSHSHFAPGMEEGLIKKRRKLLGSGMDSPQALLQGLQEATKKDVHHLNPESSHQHDVPSGDHHHSDGNSHIPLQELSVDHIGQ